MAESKNENGIGNYFQESAQELKKVTWPTRNQAVRLTLIVLGFSILFAAFIGVLDLAFSRGYQLIVNYAAQINPPSSIENIPLTPPAETPATPETPAPSPETPSSETPAPSPAPTSPSEETTPETPATNPATPSETSPAPETNPPAASPDQPSNEPNITTEPAPATPSNGEQTSQ